MLKLIEFMTLSVLVTTAMGFILSESQCSVPAPCSCSPISFNCANAFLTDVPTITIIRPEDQRVFYISLNDNNLTVLPRNAFININRIHPSSVEINLESNKIANISEDAFTGVENTTVLSLGDNRLTSLPPALGKLDKLQKLTLVQNPLSYLDPAVLAHLGQSLTHFLLNMQYLSVWPREVSKTFHILEDLTIENTHFRYLPFDAFDAFSSSLRHLSINKSTLARFPIAICHLHGLDQLRITFTSVFDSKDAFDEPCPTPLRNLTLVIVDGGNLRTFPKLLLDFPAVDTLQLRNHELQFIYADAIPESSVLQSLDLSNNSLPRIPFALNKFSNLTRLTLTFNRITSVEEHDLIGLSSLEDLRLSNNPIEYVAPGTFKNNTLLRSLFLDNTRLHLIPEAVLSAPDLYRFHFGGNNAECSCRLSYLKGWDVPLLDQCANRHDSIQIFISTSLPACP